MKLELCPVSVEEKEILKNLLEKYDYEFSQYDRRDVNALGLYGYDYLDYYWTEPNRWAFFLRVDGKLAGFVMVNDYPEADYPTDYCLSEFFVLYKYRRMGVGKAAAFAVFDRFPGRWQLKRHPKNLPSVRFWDRVVSEYTGGDFILHTAVPGTEYADQTPGDVFLFDNTTKKVLPGEAPFFVDEVIK